MKRKYTQRFTLSLMSTLLFGFSSGALAANTWTEARGDAMGGTGVASAHYGAAALANPALLTRYDQSDDISLMLPAVGARVPGPESSQVAPYQSFRQPDQQRQHKQWQ